MSVFVHFLWEMLQSFAYAMDGQSLMYTVLKHLWATAGDGALMVVIYAVVAFLVRNPRWIDRVGVLNACLVVALGAALAIGIERWALSSGRWAYTGSMPIIPWVNVGLLPVAQLMLLPFLVFWSSARLWPMRF